MVKIKWTVTQVLEVTKEARKEGQTTADLRLIELTDQEPKYAVMDDSTMVGQLLDCCGMANLRILARGKFYTLTKKLSQERSYKFYRKHGYYDNGHLQIFGGTTQQEMSVNIAACKAQANVLKKHGVETRVESWID